MPEPRFDVTTLGEMLLRLSVPSGQRLENATKLDVHPAGAEANVATLLARLERKICWIGALPDNPPGRLAANALRAAGVDLSGILWRNEGRLGTYYVEFGELPRGIQVTYDRRGSCAAGLMSAEVDWDTLMDTRILHLTGITPALSPSCLEITQAAIHRAKDHGVPVSFDVNHRHKLWENEAAARTLLPLMQGVEILFCSQRDAIGLFQCAGSMQEIAGRMLALSQARYVVLTFAEQGALLWNGKEWLHEAAPTTHVVDRLGAGDALAAGVIHGWLDGDMAAGLRYGTILAALALSQVGDMVITNRAELRALSRGNSALSR